MYYTTTLSYTTILHYIYYSVHTSVLHHYITQTILLILYSIY